MECLLPQSQNLIYNLVAHVRVPKLFIQLKNLLSSKLRDITAEPNLVLTETTTSGRQFFTSFTRELHGRVTQQLKESRNLNKKILKTRLDTFQKNCMRDLQVC